MQKKTAVLVFALLAGSVSAVCLNTTIPANSPSDIAARLTPPGAGTVVVGSAVVQRDANAPTRSPQEIYDTHCVVCHGAGVAGAPKMKDPSAWSPRLKQGMATLLKHVKEGYKVMPAMGTCADCSDQEFQNTIKLMSGS